MGMPPRMKGLCLWFVWIAKIGLPIVEKPSKKSKIFSHGIEPVNQYLTVASNRLY